MKRLNVTALTALTTAHAPTQTLLLRDAARWRVPSLA